MREIKFRGWMQSENEMIEWNELLKMNLEFIFKMQDKSGITLMQYTGLKDKNRT